MQKPKINILNRKTKTRNSEPKTQNSKSKIKINNFKIQKLNSNPKTKFKIQNPKTKIWNLKPRNQNPKSEIKINISQFKLKLQNPKTNIQNSESKNQNSKFKMQNLHARKHALISSSDSMPKLQGFAAFFLLLFSTSLTYFNMDESRIFLCIKYLSVLANFW